MTAARFPSTLLSGHKGLACEVPFDPSRRWSIPLISIGPRRRGYEVAATVDDHSFNSFVVARSRKHWLLVSDETAEAIGKGAGDAVRVAIAPRDAPSKHPIRKGTAQSLEALERLRKICNRLPECYEKVAWGAPTFRAGIKGKMFATFSDHHHDDGRVAVLCPAPEGAQEDLVASDPDIFFIPPYVGVKGWIGIRLDREFPDGALSAFIDEAYQMVAPPRLRAALGKR